MLPEVQFFISQMDAACKVNDRDWYITIFHCDNTVLGYAGQQFLVVHAPNGHVSVKIPPGKYYAVGVWSYWTGPDGDYYGNHFTHKAIFQVCCNDHKCVWLYNPSIHDCGIIYNQALQDFRTNIDQTEQNLIADGVPVTDPRMIAIDNTRNTLNTNMPAVEAIKEAIREFAIAFNFDIPDGVGINQTNLLNNPNAQQMEELTTRNSEKIPEKVTIIGELNASIV